MSERSEKPIVIPGPSIEESQGSNDPNRRGGRRFPFTAAADVLDVRSETRVAGRCSDLSLGGCYIDTLSPFAVGSLVRVRIERDLRPFEAEAVVTYAQVPMGMGLAFTEIKPEHQTVLLSWIAELSGENSPDPRAAASGPEAGILTAIENHRQVLNELIKLMVRKKILTENEGSSLLRQTFGLNGPGQLP